MSAKVFIVVRLKVAREFVTATHAPRVGELLSSRHPGLFDADVSDDAPPSLYYTLQRAMWLVDRPARWFADLVRQGELRAYRVAGELGEEIVFDARAINRLVSEGMIEGPPDDWCCRVESVVPLPPGGDADAVIHAGSLPAGARREDDRQLALQF